MASRRACALATVAAVATSLVVAGATTGSAAAAPAAVPVQVGTVADQLVDVSRHTLYLAGDAGVDAGPGPSDRIKVDGIDGAHSLALAADGTVYAAGDDALWAITPDTLTVSQIGTGEYGCLGDVAVTSSGVWFVSGCDASGATDQRVVRRAADGSFSADLLPAGQPGPIALASAPGAPDLLVVADHAGTTDSDGTEVVRPRFRAFDTAPAVPAELARHNYGGEGYRPVLALSADGSRLVAGAGYAVGVFATSTGAPVADLRTDWIASAAAITADGRYAAVARPGAFTPTLDVYRSSGTHLSSRPVDDPVAGLAWDGASLHAVDRRADADQLRTLPAAYRNSAALVVYGQTQHAYWDQRQVIEGFLYTEARDPAPDVELTVSRSGPGGRVTIGHPVTGRDGHFVVRDTPGLGGTFRYSVTRSADDEYTALSATTTWTVDRHTPALRIRTDRSRYVATQRGVVTATLGRSFTNKVVSIYASAYGRKTVRLAHAKVDRHGQLTLHIYVPWSATFTARYAGDARYSAASTEVSVTAKARLDTALSKPVSKRKGYAVYRRAKGVVFYVRVLPVSKGSGVHFSVQRYTHGAWHRYGYGDGRQAEDGVTGIRFTGSAGVRYRIRANVDTNGLRLGNASAWRYVTFQ